MGIAPFLTASAVDVVVAQRLARRLCNYCKRRTVLTTEALKGANFHDAAFDIEAYEPVGCARCGGTGYKGRVGIYEVMTVTDEIREMTIERKDASHIGQKAVEQGMRLLRDDGLEKVRLGVTSITEVARVAS
jgi:type IV pilus assembly protein PilB